jgi:hypothetical protein
MSKWYYVIGNILGKMTQILNPFNLWDSMGWWNLWTQAWSLIVIAIYIGIDAQVTLNVLHSKNKFTLSFILCQRLFLQHFIPFFLIYFFTRNFKKHAEIQIKRKPYTFYISNKLLIISRIVIEIFQSYGYV